jgi:maleylacetoacetate isomerase
VLRLYGFWRSSAVYRVRIALNLKGQAYETVPVHLVKDGGEQHTAAFAELNPQELVPVLKHGHRILRQSLAIIDYIDETWPEPPLLPSVARDRQRVRAIAQMIACEIHPLNNLRVLNYLIGTLGLAKEQKDGWYRYWVDVGFEALEKSLSQDGRTGRYCHGDAPTLADICLVPQIANARRFDIDMSPYPTLTRIEAALNELPAFAAAAPARQPDAE